MIKAKSCVALVVSLSLALVVGTASVVLSADAAPASNEGSPEAGKALFEQNCTVCHTIGGGKKLGPDLKGVTDRRSTDWLVKWISDPGKMLDEKDPIATGLLKDANGVRMYNLHLSEEQLSDVLAYLKTQGSSEAAPKSAAEESPKEQAQESPQASTEGSPDKGKIVFDQKCTMCHTVGGGKRIGPDLKGATERRSKEWLVKWISDPQKMLDNKDPIATELLKEFNGVRMIDQNLFEEQVSDVIAYLKSN